MMRIVALLFILLLNAQYAWATVYWADASTGNDANSCATSSTTDKTTSPSGYKLTPQAAVTCASAGDTVVLLGTFTGTTAKFQTMTGGTSSSNRTKIEGNPNDSDGCALTSTCSTILRVSGSGNNTQITADHMEIRKLTFDATVATRGTYPFYVRQPYTDILVEDVEVYGTEEATASSVSCVGSDPDASFIRWNRMNVHNCGNMNRLNGSPDHGGYLQAQDQIIENSLWHHNAFTGFQCYSSVAGKAANRCTARNNEIYSNGGDGVDWEGNDGLFYNNKVYSNGSNGIVIGFGTCARTKVFNNVFDGNDVNSVGGKAISIGRSSNCDNSIIHNNVTFGSSFAGDINVDTSGGTSIVTISYNACKSSSSCGSTGKLTIAALTDIFLSSTDYRLKPGSSAIEAGIAVTGSPYNGSAPDIGTYEAFSFSSAFITANTVDVTLSMNLNTPVMPTTAGWSIACTPAPTACPTPTIAGVSMKTGTSSVVSVTYSGTACSTGQTWTVTYDGTTGDTTDGINFTDKQELTSFTTQPVTNACTGGGGTGLPGTPYALYEFDGNANDTSGNSRHATEHGISYVTGKYGQGMKTDPGEDDYVEIPYFAGINPSTQSLTIAGGFYIASVDSSKAVSIGGTATGTNQRLHLYYNLGTYRMALQANTGSLASEFVVTPGWHHACITLNASTDSATLWIDGVAGAVYPASVQGYDSFIFAGNFRIGRFSGASLASGPDHIYDRWAVYQSVENCATLYDNFEPPPLPWTGTLSAVSARFYAAKTDAAGSVIPMTLSNNLNISAPAGAIMTYAVQTDCTAANCTPIGQRLYYSCAACPSGGSDLPVPDSASTDGIEFHGAVAETGLLSGAHGANLSGALTHVPGSTNLTSDAVPVFDLAQDTSTVQRYIVRIVPGTANGRVFCLKPREQSGLELDSYTPSSGLCLTVENPNGDQP